MSIAGDSHSFIMLTDMLPFDCSSGKGLPTLPRHCSVSKTRISYRKPAIRKRWQRRPCYNHLALAYRSTLTRLHGFLHLSKRQWKISRISTRLYHSRRWNPIVNELRPQRGNSFQQKRFQPTPSAVYHLFLSFIRLTRQPKPI